MSRCHERGGVSMRRLAFAAWMLLPVSGCSYHPAVCGLRPLSPDLTAGSVSDTPVFTEAASLQPTLRWERFPRPSDLRTDPDGLFARVRDVTYELRIWRVEENGYGKRVYDRVGLADPEHRIELLLQPSRKYRWSVRARFRVGEETRVIPWGFSKVPGIPGINSCVVPNDIPASNLYRFRTPDR